MSLDSFVIKGGGTTCKDAAAINNFAEIISNHWRNQNYSYFLAMASAPGKLSSTQAKMTDLCENIYFNIEPEQNVNEIEKRFTEIIRDLNLQQETGSYLTFHMQDLHESAKKISTTKKIELKEDRDTELYARICSIGERINAKILTEHLKKKFSIEPVFLDYDQFGMEVTGPWDDSRVTRQADRMIWQTLQQHKTKLCVVTPFLGYKKSDNENKVACLGRGGSDYSATKLGEIISAKEIFIYSDQPGLLRADPQLFQIGSKPEAMHKVSYSESLEFAGLGASIILDRAIRPARRSRSDIFLKDSGNPKGSGTIITYDSGYLGVKAVATVPNLRLLSVFGTETQKMGRQGATGSILSKFGNHGVNIKFHVDRGWEGDTYAFHQHPRMGEVECWMNNEGYRVITRQPMTRLSIIGEGVSTTDYITMLSTLNEKQIKLRGGGFGGESDITRTVFVDGEDGQLGTHVLYNAFFNT